MLYINGTPVNTTIFPDGTSQVWQLPSLQIPNTNWVHIKWDFQHEGEFMQLAQLKDLIDKVGFGCALRITYLPYGRQDKEISNTTTFGLHTFANLLNSLDFDEVIIHDPHSKIALDLINNSKAVYPTKEVQKVISLTSSDILCYPDAGALTKYNKIYQKPYIYANKTRDQITGEIKSYKLMGGMNTGTKVLIVDDICDGGATFINLSNKLLDAGVKEVNLFVSHGIFSKGLRPLYEAGINRIFTQAGEASEIQNNIVYRRLSL